MGNTMAAPEHCDIHSEAFLRHLMRGQFRLSLVCASAFMTGLFGLPLANYCYPEVMASRVFGFTLTWLILGVGFFPAVWVIAWVFIGRSIALEEREVARASPRGDTAMTVGADGGHSLGA
jgi:uncharacterized membrane protein (DUF485 family)